MPIPTTIGAYRFERYLDPMGRGLFDSSPLGRVFLAVHVALDRKVVIKVLHERLTRQARAAARLQHPSIIGILDLINKGDLIYIVYEYIDGANLATLIDRGNLSLSESIQIALDISLALSYGHSQGLVHGNVSSGNVLIDQKTGSAKLADFGLAGRTILYMAPESLRSDDNLDYRSEIYSLGATFYRLFTGKFPYKDGPFHLPEEKPVSPISYRQDLPRKLNDLIENMLESNIDKRPSMSTVIRVIEEVFYFDFDQYSGRRELSADTVSPEVLSRPGVRILSPRPLSIRLNEVWLGTALPRSVGFNNNFVARFSAYISEYRSQVAKAIDAETLGARKLFDLHACQWEPGTKVSVALSADHLVIAASPQSFVWNGKWVILRFDVSVPDSVEATSVILRFDVSIEGLIVARLRPEIQIAKASANPSSSPTSTEMKAPDTAFASYATRDRREVLGRIRSLQIFTKIDVFLDCLSIHPGELWKDKIKTEIKDRDIFWLFWSRHARQSSWVEWEWRTALTVKTLAAIQPHPLEGPEIAPPPAELADLQFGTLYESFLSQMRSTWWDRRLTQSRKVVRRVAASPLILVLVLLLLTLGVIVGRFVR